MNLNIKNKIENILRHTTDDSEMLYKLKQLLYEADFEQNNIRHSKSMAELISANIKQIQDKTIKSKTIKTGFTSLDDIFGGFELGETVVIGGRPSMGKTQLLVNLSLHISQTMPVLYFSFDLSESSLSNRFLSCVSGIATEKIMKKNLSEDEIQTLIALETNFKNHNIQINVSYNNSISAFKSHCEKQIKENDIKVIVVDHLQMMGCNNHRYNREHEVAFISRVLKNIAKSYNVCVILTSQLSRAVENRGYSKRPQLSDLRESGAIEQDADKVIFIYRPEYYNIDEDDDRNSTDRIVELIVAKNRTGVLGKVKLLRDENFTRFRDFDPNKNEFTFSKNRLDELTEKNPNLKNLLDEFGIEDTPI
jgi:replicative DNA helicase